MYVCNPRAEVFESRDKWIHWTFRQAVQVLWRASHPKRSVSKDKVKRNRWKSQYWLLNLYMLMSCGPQTCLPPHTTQTHVHAHMQACLLAYTHAPFLHSKWKFQQIKRWPVECNVLSYLWLHPDWCAVSHRQTHWSCVTLWRYCEWLLKGNCCSHHLTCSSLSVFSLFHVTNWYILFLKFNLILRIKNIWLRSVWFSK